MGSSCFKKKIKIFNKFPKEEKSDSVRPSSKVNLSYDKQFEVPNLK